MELMKKDSMLNKIGIGRTAEIFEIENNKILKLYFKRIPDEVAIMEYEIHKKINNLDIPIAVCYDLIQQDGRYGITMEKINGISMMKFMSENPMTSMQQAKKLAQLHSTVHVIKNPGLTQYKDQLRQRIDAVPIISNSDKNKIFAYLKKLPEGDSLCHGDFHPENILFANKKDYIIDWMTATQGNLCSDVAHTDLLLRYAVSPENKHGIEMFITNMVRNKFADTYIHEYLRGKNIHKQDIKVWKLPHMASMLNDIMPDSTKDFFLREIQKALKNIS